MWIEEDENGVQTVHTATHSFVLDARARYEVIQVEASDAYLVDDVNRNPTIKPRWVEKLMLKPEAVEKILGLNPYPQAPILAHKHI